jgi:uncharacterized protein YydD (DUF2326 family)
MLKRIRSSLPSFNEVPLTGGMNVILADRAKDSEETESTNGLGKSTLVRIIHFCLGSDFSREKVLDHPELKGVIFYLDFEWNGIDCTIARSTAKDKTVRITSEFLKGLELEDVDLENGDAEISLDAWKIVLSKRYYPEAAVGEKKFAPSFRDLAGYFLRVGKAAYVDPQTAFQNQSGATKRLCVSFLLRLNWSKQREMESESQKREQNAIALDALRAAEDSNDILTIGDL